MPKALAFVWCCLVRCAVSAQAALSLDSPSGISKFGSSRNEIYKSLTGAIDYYTDSIPLAISFSLLT